MQTSTVVGRRAPAECATYRSKVRRKGCEGAFFVFRSLLGRATIEKHFCSPVEDCENVRIICKFEVALLEETAAPPPHSWASQHFPYFLFGNFLEGMAPLRRNKASDDDETSRALSCPWQCIPPSVGALKTPSRHSPPHIQQISSIPFYLAFASAAGCNRKVAACCSF